MDGSYQRVFGAAGPTLLEPIMKVVVTTPKEFQGNVTGDLNRRRGLIVNSEERGNTTIIEAEVPLSEMFGYTTELRSMSTGRAASAMEPLKYSEVPTNVRKQILEENACFVIRVSALIWGFRSVDFDPVQTARTPT